MATATVMATVVQAAMTTTRMVRMDGKRMWTTRPSRVQVQGPGLGLVLAGSARQSAYIYACAVCSLGPFFCVANTTIYSFAYGCHLCSFCVLVLHVLLGGLHCRTL